MTYFALVGCRRCLQLIIIIIIIIIAMTMFMVWSL